MSKVICDICGTTYAETATQCPVCGSAKVSSAQTAAQTEGEAREYTYTRGGHFSKSNVRRRNQEKTETPQRRRPAERSGQRKPTDNNANIALIAVVVLLLLAIIAVVIYIAVRVIGPAPAPNDPGTSQPALTEPSQPSVPNPQEIPCTGLQATQTITISELGGTWTIQVEKAPADTTDTVSFESADAAIATVSETGVVTAVAAGETTVTIKCGAQTAQCKIIVSAGSVQPPDDPVQPDVELKLNREDFSMFSYGEKWKLYSGSSDPSLITWISDDPAVCTVENGVVVAVGPGQTKVHAQYGGETVTCIVRCNSSVVKPDTDPSVLINKTDVTISVGEKFTLTLSQKVEGQASSNMLNVTWTASKEGIVTIDGNKITGAAADLEGVIVSAVYEGKTYKCIVRVKAAA